MFDWKGIFMEILVLPTLVMTLSCCDMLEIVCVIPVTINSPCSSFVQ